MHHPAFVPVWRTVTNWLITVVIGSILWPVIAASFSRSGPGSTLSDDVFGFMIISMIMSALTSLPAMVILLVTNIVLNKQRLEFRRHQLIQNVVHIIVAVLTFAILGIASINELSARDLSGIVIMLTYPAVGIIVWNITYALQKRRRPQTRIEASEDILDDPLS